MSTSKPVSNAVLIAANAVAVAEDDVAFHNDEVERLGEALAEARANLTEAEGEVERARLRAEVVKNLPDEPVAAKPGEPVVVVFRLKPNDFTASRPWVGAIREDGGGWRITSNSGSNIRWAWEAVLLDFAEPGTVWLATDMTSIEHEVPEYESPREPEQAEPEPPTVVVFASEFNKRYPIGTKVKAWPLTLDDDPLLTITRGKAWELGDGTPVVSVEGYSGGIALTHIKVVE